MDLGRGVDAYAFCLIELFRVIATRMLLEFLSQLSSGGLVQPDLVPSACSESQPVGRERETVHASIVPSPGVWHRETGREVPVHQRGARASKERFPIWSQGDLRNLLLVSD